MLKKLYSYDFGAIGKKMWLFTLILLGTTAVGCGAVSALNYIEWESFKIATGGLMAGLGMLVFLSYAAIIAYSVIAFVMIIARFYSNLFTDEGYLTFTLPVKTGTIYDAKLLAGGLWMVITSAVELVCLAILIMFTINFDNLPEFIAGLSEGLKFVFEYVPAGHIAAFIVEFILICVLSLAYQIVLLYISITIAAVIAKKARFVIGTVFYFIINSVVGTVGSVITVIVMIAMSSSTMFGIAMTEEVLDMASTISFACWEFHAQFIVNIFVFGAAAVAGYFINKSLLKNKLNLP